jgi:hypothetical protein
MSRCVIRLPGPLRIVAVAWLVVLPWIGCRPPIGRFLRAMEEGNVSPSAMVYGGAFSDLVGYPRRDYDQGVGIGRNPAFAPLENRL